MCSGDSRTAQGVDMGKMSTWSKVLTSASVFSHVAFGALLRIVGRTEAVVREQAARAVTGLVGEAGALLISHSLTVESTADLRPSRDVLYSRSGEGHGVQPAVLDRRGR